MKRVRKAAAQPKCEGVLEQQMLPVVTAVSRMSQSLHSSESAAANREMHAERLSAEPAVTACKDSCLQGTPELV
jgi:hypothetical protein